MPEHPGSGRALRRIGAPVAMALGIMAVQPASAEPIFKCGKAYTNVPADAGPGKARARDCVLVETSGRPKGKSENISVDGSTQITVPVGQDGRFWIRGTVNGFPVQFAIDRTATVNAGVAVTEDFAARANLIGGTPTYIQTAATGTDARRIERVPMTFGPFRVPQATVVIGPLGGKSTDAVLGPELLSLFDVTANDRELTIVGK